MSHLPTLIYDLALILIVAGIVTIVFKFLKQPVVLGYIIAGFLVSPHFVLMPSVADLANITTWSEIGVIFLLFSLGLEFSFKKLMRVGGAASIATLINLGSMLIIGYLIGMLLHWTHLESLFLGGMLSMSSTTIIIKAFNDMGLQKKRFAGIVFGMLIVEDLAAILMMVIFSTVADSEQMEAQEFILSIAKLFFFVLIWFVAGIYLIPSFLKKFKKYLNDETLLIMAIGLCLSMVLFADKVGFSAALGAFIMGSILAETTESKHIEHLVEPLKNLFGAVFFVSVGMMIVPAAIVEHIGLIALLTGVVLVGRVIFATLGVLASGEGLKVSMKAGLSLAQIGEFSFIIATLGLQLGVISGFIYPVIVAVSVITTFTTPYLIKFSGPAYQYMEKIIPARWDKLILGHTAVSSKSINNQSNWEIVLKRMLISATIYFSLSLAMMYLSKLYIAPFIREHIAGIWGEVVGVFVTLLLMSPFLNAIVMRRNKSKEYRALWANSRTNKAALISIRIIRMALCMVLILMVLVPQFPQAKPLLFLIATVIVVFFAFTDRLNLQSIRFKRQFLKNLNNNEEMEERASIIKKRARAELTNSDIHIEEIEVSVGSSYLGRKLGDIDTLQQRGVNIISIIRGEKRVNFPDDSTVVYPYDKMIIAGTDSEIEKFAGYLGEQQECKIDGTCESYQIDISQFELVEHSPLIGHSIGELRIKDRTECMIIGIDRDSTSMPTFNSSTVLEQGDVLWLAGETKKLKGFEGGFGHTDSDLR